MFTIPLFTSHQVQPRFAARAAIEVSEVIIYAPFDTQRGQVLSVALRLTGGHQE